MFRTFILSVLLFFQCFILNAQVEIKWAKTYGGSYPDNAYSVQQTTDGGYIVVGRSLSNNGDVSGNHGGYDFWMVKLDAQGDLTWQKSLGGNGADKASSVQQTSDGGYIIAGTSSSTTGDVTGNHGGDDFWLAKTDNQGNLVWQKCLGGSGTDLAHSVQQTSDGGYIVAGSTSSNNGDVSGNHNPTSPDYWVVKLDGQGNITWQKCLGGSGFEYAREIQQTTDGGYIVAGGSSYSNNGDITEPRGGTDYWVVKLDGQGNITWQKCLGGTGYQFAFAIQQTSDGGYIVAGETTQIVADGDVSAGLGSGGGDFWVVKIDGQGNVIWEKVIGGTGYERAHGVKQTADGGYIVTGYSSSNDVDVSGNHGGQYDCWIVKLSSQGAIEGQVCIGGTAIDESYSICQATDGAYIIAGRTNSSDGDIGGTNGDDDFLVTKVCINGCQSTAIKENIVDDSFMLFPNPIYDKVTISRSDSFDEVNIELLDITGRLIDTYVMYQGEHALIISTEQLKSGVYFLRFNKVLTKQIIKE